MSAHFSATNLKLSGSGSALPGQPVDNDTLLDALRRSCGAKAERLARRYVRRLGIESRHLSRDLSTARSGTVAGLDAPALCCQALNRTSAAGSITFLIGHTATPHSLLPPNVSWVAETLRYGGPYLELRQACTGFASALTVAAAMIAENARASIGIVGSETGSPYFEMSEDFADREQLINYVQMGDGAGAIVVGAADENETEALITDVYTGHIGLDMPPGISLHGGGSADPGGDRSMPYFRHDAAAVRKNGEKLILAGIDAIESRGYRLDDFDWILPHQANGHIAELMAARFPALAGKIVVTAKQLGNLGSAAIWVGLDRLRRSGELKRGQRVLVLGAEASKYLFGGFVYTH